MKLNRFLGLLEINNFFAVVFSLFLSIACYGQSNVSDKRTILLEKAQLEMNSKQYDDCIATCQELGKVLIWANQSDTQIYVDCLSIEVLALYHSQRNLEAISLAEKALKIQEKISGTSTSIYAGMLTHLGICYYNNNPLKSVECQKNALQIYENLYGINSKKCYQTLCLYVKSLQHASMYKEAYEVCKKRLEVAENLYTQKSEAVIESLLNLALIAQKLSYIKGEQLFINITMDLVNNFSFSNKGSYVNFWYNLALVFEDYNHFGAIMVLEECVSFLDYYIYRDENMYIDCVSMLGTLYYSESNFNRALMCFEKESNLCKQYYGENSIMYVSALVDLAQCKPSNEAYEIYHKALNILKNVSCDNDIYNYAKTLIKISRNFSLYAQSLNKCGLNKKALKINKEAYKEIHQVINTIKQQFGRNHDLMYDARQVLGRIYSNMSQHKESLLIAKENLMCAELQFGKESYSYARALAELATTCSQAKMFEDANMYNEQSLALFTKAGDYSTDECLNIIMREISDRLSSNRKDSGIVYLFEDYLARLKDNVIEHFAWMNSEERCNFARKKIENNVISILLNEDNLRKNDPRINKLCYNALLLLKGLLLNSDIDFRKAIEKSNISSIKTDYQKLISKRVELEKFIKQKNHEDVKYDTQRKEILRSERFLAQDVISIDYFSNKIRINYQDIKNHLRKNEVVVDFYKYLGIYFAFVVSSDNNLVNVFQVCSDQDLKKIGKNKCYETDSLYNAVWKPLESVIGTASTVYFIPDGELYSLALESADLQQKRIYHRLSSSRQICLKRDSILGNEAVIYGGIDFDVDSCEQKKEETQEKCTLRSLRETLDFLLGSQKEATEISKILSQSGFKVKLLTGQSASEESFKNLSDSNVNILHVSTHGYCWSQRKYESMVTNSPLLNQGNAYLSDEDFSMVRTGLMFAGANNAFVNKVGNANMDDGILTAKEICNLNLQNIDLVVLSACRTGLGEVSRDGVYGLQRAFKKAGVKSILMSLWAIDDSITKDLMVHFYKGLVSGLSKEKALLQAKILIREKYPHSNDWAAFVLLD